MIKERNKKQVPSSQKEDRNDLYEFPGYPLYPRCEDIYNKSKLVQEIDPEDITRLKEVLTQPSHLSTIDLNSLDELDVPGSELDDEDEKVGSEDEENNYYSLGGEEHDDLEEDKGE